MKHITLLAASLLAVSATAQIADESFENTGAGSGEWTEASTNFTTPLCNPTCFSTPANAARTGWWWAWFGGAGGSGATIPEIGSLDQDVPIPAGSTVDLTMWVWMPFGGGAVADFLEVNVDGNQEALITTDDSATYVDAYTEVVVSLGAYAAGTHNIELYSEQTDGDTIGNFFVDDVVIEVNGIPVLGIFENESMPGMTVVPNPANDVLTMTFNAMEGMGVVNITDLNGRVISSQQLAQVSRRTFTYDSSMLPNGIYMVSVENAGKVYTQRVVVAH